MQVTQVEDRIAHAVVGPGKAQSFQIAQTAEFFQVLSSSLYSDKPLAVVRETLCNAWDAHIEAECTDKPVEVTIKDGKLIIKDFGKGIPNDQIVPIYGTYGGSTKVGNEDVTGGFGLGCKAPFAYVDHFEVISCHNHIKTIYQMSLSSAQIGGLPSITEILSIPTTESGLTVTIDIKPEDVNCFIRLVRRIASFGEMNVRLNDSIVDTLPFSEAEHGFLFVRRNDLFTNNNRSIFVRYGNVVYPVFSHENYFSEYRRIEKFLRHSLEVYGSSDWIVLFQAQPNSITVTPSRESLSMTDHTIATIKRLLNSFNSLKNSEINQYIDQLGEDAVSQTFLLSSPACLFDIYKQTVPNLDKAETSVHHFKYLTNSLDIAKYLILKRYPNREDFHQKQLIARLRTWVQSGFDKRGVGKQLLKAIQINKKWNKTNSKYWGYHTSWFHKKYLCPILRKMPDELDQDRLFVFGQEIRSVQSPEYSRRSPVIPAYSIKKWAPQSVEDCIPFMRDIVVIAYTRSDVYRADQVPVLKHWLGRVNRGCLFYYVQRNSKHVDKARDFFTKLGMTVIDLTVRYPWEPEEAAKPAPKIEVVKPRKKGLPKLSSALIGGRLSINALWDENTERSEEEPEFYIQASPREHDTRSLQAFSEPQSIAIVRLFGNRGVAARYPAQVTKLESKKIPRLVDWLPKQLLEEFKKNPLIQLYYQLSEAHRNDGSLDYDKEAFLNLIKRDPILCKKFKIPSGITQRELDFVQIYSAFSNYYTLRTNPEIKAISELIKRWDRHPSLKKVVEMLHESKLIWILNSSGIKTILESNPDPILKKKAREIFLTALRG